MEPELLVFNHEGVYGRDLQITRKKLLRRGAHRPQRIVLVCPAIAPIDPKVMFSQWNVLFPQNQRVQRVLALGQEVGHAYANAFEGVLTHPEYGQYEYFLTMETDNMPPPDGLMKLLARMEAHPEFTAIAGLYFTKGDGGYAMIMGDPEGPTNFRPQLPVDDALIECCAVPTGFTLWRMADFRASARRAADCDWFIGQTTLGGVISPDIHFWTKARPFGFRCAVDCSVKVGHYDIESGVIF